MLKRIITIISLLAFLLSPADMLRAENSDSAVLYFAPDLENYFDPEFLYVDIIVNPAGELINAVSVDINYDPAYLALESDNFESSFCQFILPTVSDSAMGIYQTACGSPIATSTGANIVKLKFKKLQAGITKFSIDDSLVLIHDGYGTPLQTISQNHYIEILK